jgi:hypothetical protein
VIFSNTAQLPTSSLIFIDLDVFDGGSSLVILSVVLKVVDLLLAGLL